MKDLPQHLTIARFDNSEEIEGDLAEVPNQKQLKCKRRPERWGGGHGFFCFQRGPYSHPVS